MILRLGTMLMIGLLGSGIVAPSSAPIEPSGKWVVAYEEGMCVLSRRYGSASEVIDIGFRPVPFVDTMQMVLIAQKGGGGPRYGKASIAFDGATSNEVPYGSYSLGTPARRVTTINTSGDVLNTMPGATTLAVTMGDATTRFALRSAGAAIKALNTCQDELVRRWGLDPAILHAESSHATLAGNEPARWFGPESYPEGALKIGAQGRTVAVLVVDVTGKATSCRVVESAGNGELDGTTCHIAMRRAAFTPARDAGGRSIASWYILPVRWILPSS